MIIHSDWHIHSEASYDAKLTLKEITDSAKEFRFRKVGITDHANFNDKKFLSNLENSAKSVKNFKKNYSDIVLGVELTPIEKPEFDYIAKNSTRDGYIPPVSSIPYGIELAQTKEELISLGVKYAIGASHWRVDAPNAKNLTSDLKTDINEWYRQQMWLACDERVTILGHPWWHGHGLWYEDFTVIPHSMNMDIAAALKENGKYAECNSSFFVKPHTSEKFRRQYAEFLRELHEMGIPITYGSDYHNVYSDNHIQTEKYLILAGFKDGDIVEIKEESFWNE